MQPGESSKEMARGNLLSAGSASIQGRSKDGGVKEALCGFPEISLGRELTGSRDFRISIRRFG